MSGITIYEFDAMVPTVPGFSDTESLHGVPPNVFNWLELQCLRTAEQGEATWMRLTQRRGRRSVQVTSFVGVIRAPDGYQIEVLPKVGKAIGGGDRTGSNRSGMWRAGKLTRCDRNALKELVRAGELKLLLGTDVASGDLNQAEGDLQDIAPSVAYPVTRIFARWLSGRK